MSFITVLQWKTSEKKKKFEIAYQKITELIEGLNYHFDPPQISLCSVSVHQQVWSCIKHFLSGISILILRIQW